MTNPDFDNSEPIYEAPDSTGEDTLGDVTTLVYRKLAYEGIVNAKVRRLFEMRARAETSPYIFGEYFHRVPIYLHGIHLDRIHAAQQANLEELQSALFRRQIESYTELTNNP
ncbi:MAG TPA: hypothetical protein VIH90_03300 [Candidatus Saccharimonadales bacterium]